MAPSCSALFTEVGLVSPKPDMPGLGETGPTFYLKASQLNCYCKIRFKAKYGL